ncbi:MAG: M48 family metallopeptidase [Comamonadaceae bacterium]|nr:MAG: M48 family metallopeptidase [Comamonadaceae bacterium]
MSLDKPIPGPLHGRWFDGRSSQPIPVLASLHAGKAGPGLHLRPLAEGTAPLVLDHGQVEWPETWSAGRAPRILIVDLGPHGSLEIDDAAQWQASLEATGRRLPLAQRMQTRWPVLLGVLLVAVAGLGAFYRWGTPWAAAQLARHVPLAWETELSTRALADLDQEMLKPSKLPAERQEQLRAGFTALARQVGPGLQRYGSYAPVLSLQFRSGMDANAFALPGGTIVLTDGLVQAAARLGTGDDALLGVLAHEIGHVVHRHTTRMVVEQGVLHVGLGLALGDVSTVVSMGSTVLTGLAYRRVHEGEADCFAVALMARAKLPTTPMADLLLGLEDARASTQAGNAKGKEPVKPGAESATGNAIASLLSSHPQTAERAQNLKQGRVEACPGA